MPCTRNYCWPKYVRLHQCVYACVLTAEQLWAMAAGPVLACVCLARMDKHVRTVCASQQANSRRQFAFWRGARFLAYFWHEIPELHAPDFQHLLHYRNGGYAPPPPPPPPPPGDMLEMLRGPGDSRGICGGHGADLPLRRILLGSVVNQLL